MPKVPQSPIANVRCAYPDLALCLRQRAEEEGYDGLGPYFLWMGAYDVELRRPHHVSAYLAHLSPKRQEEEVAKLVADFHNPSEKKRGSLFEARLHMAAQEETWRLHAIIREKDERIRELEQELARERQQPKLDLSEQHSA